MKLRRSNWVYSVCSLPTSLGLNIFHRIEYSGVENIPKQGPAILLPKHQVLRDIPIEGLFLKYKCKRYGSWVMKASLPGLLYLLGGVPIHRPKDFKKKKERKDLPREEKMALKAERKRKFELSIMDSMGYLEWLYTHGEIVVVHPEGTRYPNAMGGAKKTFIEHARQVERECGIKIPAIPVGIEYESFNTLDSKVCLRAGEPLDLAMPDLVKVVMEEIRKLSNL